MTPRPDADALDRLLRRSGRRPPVPLERARRVEAAVAAHWRWQVRRRRFARAAWVAAALVFLAVGTAGLLPRRAPERVAGPAASVDVIVAGAWSTAAGSPRAVRPGDTIAPGASVATEDTGGAALRLRSGHSVRLDAATTVRVVSDRAIALADGAVYVDSRSPSGIAAGPLEVRTRWGTVRDLGTQFEVRVLEDALRLRVREGSVELRAPRRTVIARAGEEVQVGRDGTLTRRTAPPHDPGWAWAASIAPLLDLQGRSVAEFVAWVGREQGRRVAYADDEVARTAARTVLSGSIDGMTLDEALDSVLPTCRMTHRVRGDVLLVEAEP